MGRLNYKLEPADVEVVSDALDYFEDGLKKSRMPTTLAARIQKQIMNVRVALFLEGTPEPEAVDNGPSTES